MPAKYPLTEVFKLIRAKKYWFSAPSRSVYEVVRVYQNTPAPKTNQEAEDYILEAVLGLTDAHYCSSSLQWDVVTDIYGTISDNRPWYVKFAISEEENDLEQLEPLLQEISFHPPKVAFKTSGGISIPAESVGGN